MGGCEDSRKISWVNWDIVCLDKEIGGLGVRRIREFNIHVLGKWWWRMLVKKESLWYKVLAARYGQVRGRLSEGEREGSVWWKYFV